MRPRPTADMRISMAAENATWPDALREIAPVPFVPGARNPPSRVWRSRFFLVQQYDVEGSPTRLTVQRTMMRDDGHWVDGIAWDDLQRLKREAGYGDHFAIECYPEDAHVVDVANMRHLWLVERPVWAWSKP